MFSLPPPPKRKNKGAQGSMFITTIMVMVSWVYACALTHQIIYVNIRAVFVYHLYFRKSEEKEKKERKGGRRREREGRKKQRGREERKEEECKKERKKTAVREGSGFSPFGTNDKSGTSHPVPIWGLDFHLSPCYFCAPLFPSERSISVTQKGRKFEIHCFLLVRKIKLWTQLMSGAQDNWEFFSRNFFFDST